MRYSMLILLLSLCACATQRPSQIPTSPRLEAIRIKQERHITQDFAKQELALGSPVFIRAFKKESRLELWVQPEESDRFSLFRTYNICKLSGALGPKLFEGDQQTPEGFYNITAKQLNPNSRYHLSFDIGFPNAYDQTHSRTGSHLMIHGNCKSEGCFAMTNEGIEEIYLIVEASIKSGHTVPVHLFPFRMTSQNLQTHYNPLWQRFWRNLKQGYDIFEMERIPPKAGHDAYKYVFNTPEGTPKLATLNHH